MSPEFAVYMLAIIAVSVLVGSITAFRKRLSGEPMLSGLVWGAMCFAALALATAIGLLVVAASPVLTGG